MYQDWNLIQQDTAAQAKIEEEQRAEREAKERLDAVWKSTAVRRVLGDDAAGLARGTGIATPSSRRRVDGVEDDARRKILISTQVGRRRRRWPMRMKRLPL